MISRDLTLLHADFANRLAKVCADLKQRSIPLEVFEGFRSANRQAELYAQGRTLPGNIVTKAKPWSSFHQYGLAVDFALKIRGVWSWDNSRENEGHWRSLHAIGEEYGLRALNFELAHLEFAGTSSGLLSNGAYPAGGGKIWAETLRQAIKDYPLGAPRPPMVNA